MGLLVSEQFNPTDLYSHGLQHRGHIVAVEAGLVLLDQLLLVRHGVGMHGDCVRQIVCRETFGFRHFDGCRECCLASIVDVRLEGIFQWFLYIEYPKQPRLLFQLTRRWLSCLERLRCLV